MSEKPTPLSKPKQSFSGQSAETAALNALLGAMNNPNIEGVVVPPGVNTQVPVLDPVLIGPRPTGLPAHVDTTGVEIPEPLDHAARAADQERIIAAQRGPVSKLFFTGRLKSGKDTSATAAGAEIIGFADPLYAVACYHFGVEISATTGKDLPGVREFLQTIGQWGRGLINEKYPLNAGRALFITAIRGGGPRGFFGFPEVDWATFGRNNDIWLNAALERANRYLVERPEKRIAFTNCRFDHEFKRLQAEGYQHWHCLCSPKTWTARLALSKLTPESPEVRDLSEQLAATLDANVVKQLSAQKTGPKLRAIWSDTHAPCPSSRLHSTESFLASIA